METPRKISNQQLKVVLGSQLSEKEVDDIGIAKNLKLVVASGCFIGRPGHMLVDCFPFVMKIEQHVDRLIDQTSIK